MHNLSIRIRPRERIHCLLLRRLCFWRRSVLSMKVLFDGCDFQSRTGPNSFAQRLATELLNQGHVIADDNDYDVVLAFIETSFRDYKAPVVLRLDGIWFKDENEFKIKNRGIKRSYEFVDHVIWQSEFDKNMVTHWWGNRSGSVVHNGIYIDPIKNESDIASEILKLRQTYDKIFCCSANWHGQKRLRQNVELFRHLKNGLYQNSCMIIMGNNAEQISGNDLFYTGNLPHEICEQVFAVSDWMIHLAYLDHCPNTVIESLMQGTPVICSNLGGTKELVQGFGVQLLEPKDYSYELIDYENPPLIDVNQISLLPETSSLGKHLDIDIKNVVKKVHFNL